MSDDYRDGLVAMARAAERDERLSDGALYGKLASEIERLQKDLALLQQKYDNLLGLPRDNLNNELNYYKSEIRLLVAHRNMLQDEIANMRRAKQ